MTVTVYGIKNCDTVKKARAWLDAHGVAYDFHDYKIAGLMRSRLEKWCDERGWETLLIAPAPHSVNCRRRIRKGSRAPRPSR